jgi:hypothetical protein
LREGSFAASGRLGNQSPFFVVGLNMSDVRRRDSDGTLYFGAYR